MTKEMTWSDGPGGLRSVDEMSGHGARWLHVVEDKTEARTIKNRVFKNFLLIAITFCWEVW